MLDIHVKKHAIPGFFSNLELVHLTILINGQVYIDAFIERKPDALIQQGTFVQFDELEFSSDSTGEQSCHSETRAVCVLEEVYARTICSLNLK
jgi:hypothetical protein